MQTPRDPFDDYGDPQFNEPDDEGAPFDAPDYVLLHDAARLWHPQTQHLDAPIPVHVERASGAWLYPTSGAPMFDAISSWGVTTHGHAHADIASAIAAQASTLGQVSFTGLTHEPAAALAAELIARMPRGLSRLFFSDNGATAVEIAVSMSLQSFANAGTPRQVIAAFEQAEHGEWFAAATAGVEVVRLPEPTSRGMLKALDALIVARGAQLAAVIVEPLLLSTRGMLVWDEDTLRAIREKTRAAGLHLIADETLTGFGRTGPLFACDRADIAPDLLCLGGALTGGALALGATAATEAIYDAFRSTEASRTFSRGHVNAANAIACAAALASLELFDEESEDHRVRIEVAHARQLESLRGTKGVRAVRQLGTIAAIEFEAAPGTVTTLGQALTAFALEQHVLLRPLANVACLMPPYCTTDDELDAVYDVLRRFAGGERASLPPGGA